MPKSILSNARCICPNTTFLTDTVLIELSDSDISHIKHIREIIRNSGLDCVLYTWHGMKWSASNIHDVLSKSGHFDELPDLEYQDSDESWKCCQIAVTDVDFYVCSIPKNGPESLEIRSENISLSELDDPRLLVLL